jgi:uncharacterized protein YkwD
MVAPEAFDRTDRQALYPWGAHDACRLFDMFNNMLRPAIAVLALATFASPAGATPADDGAARQLLDRTNRLRAQNGLAELKAQPQLAAAAMQFARYMADSDRYSHEADGRQPPQRAQAAGYAYCLVSENIAFASDSRGFDANGLAARLFDGWRDSPPHRRNMLDGELTEVGIAAAYSQRSKRHYAVQLFGRPRTQALRFSLANATTEAVHYELAGRRYEIAPGVVRNHEQCRSARLQVTGLGTALAVEPGGRYRLEGGHGALRVQRE